MVDPKIETIVLDEAELIEEFEQGSISYDELKDVLGVPAAKIVKNHHEDSLDSLFDDPEDL